MRLTAIAPEDAGPPNRSAWLALDGLSRNAHSQALLKALNARGTTPVYWSTQTAQGEIAMEATGEVGDPPVLCRRFIDGLAVDGQISVAVRDYACWVGEWRLVRNTSESSISVSGLATDG